MKLTTIKDFNSFFHKDYFNYALLISLGVDNEWRGKSWWLLCNFLH